MSGTGSLLEVTSQSAIHHVLHANPTKIQRLSFSNPYERLSDRQRALADLALSHRIQIAYGARHDKMGEGISALIKSFEYRELKPFIAEEKDKTRSLVLILDHLQDTQNFGALARTAEGLGADAIIIPKDRSVQVNGGVYNTSVGAIETIPVIQVSNIAESLKRLKDNGYWIVGSALTPEAKSLTETPNFEKVGLVLGSELEGLSDHVIKTCDWLVKITMTGKIDSLNVSAAGAILMYHFVRR